MVYNSLKIKPMKHLDLITEDEQEDQKLYLIHHMHYYQGKNDAIHEIHHCFLFSDLNMQGKKYSTDHLLLERKLYHIINGDSPEVLYDHANNSFKIEELSVKGKKCFILK